MSFSEWKRCKLGDLLNFRRGHDLPKKNMVYGIYPVVGSNGVIGYHNEYTTDSPCLTVGRSGNIGTPHFLKQKCWAHNTTLYIDDFKGNNPEYIYYLLKTLNLGHYGGGSAVPTLNRNHIHPIEIKYTENCSEQKSISKILSDLDNKIETNNQINKNLEEMSQAIFKQWFVDFEFPNEDGEPYKSSGGEMVESELGMIPKGWNIRKLSELAEMKNGVNYGRDQEGKKVKVVNVRDFDSSILVNNEKLDSVFLPEKQINDYRLKKYDTVIVRSAKPGETLLVNDDNIKVYSGFTIRIRVNDNNMKLYTFFCVRNAVRKLENSSNGTIFKNLNQQLLGSLDIVEPSTEILKKYSDFIKSIIDKIYVTTEEINNLIGLRDTLLQKLMSGEIRVPLE